jgi:hypothetical protein
MSVMRKTILYFIVLINSIAFAQIPTNGLNANYDFTNGSLVNAISGNSFTQTGTSLATTNDRFSTANNAISLNGDYLSTGNIDYGETGSGNNTQVTTSLSFWVKTSSNNTQIETIIDESQRASTSTWYGYYIYLENGKIKVDARYQLERFFPTTQFTYKSILAESTSVIADGNWHHIVVSLQLVRSFQFTYDNEYTAKIYVDTLLEDTGYNIDSGNIVSPISHDVAVDFTVGNRYTGGLTSTEVYKDEIDDILVYNRLLTNTEITQIGTDNSFCFAQSAADLTISNKTETSLDISWPKDGGFELAYVVSGQPFSGATIIPVNGYTSGNLESITGLTANTNYDIYIREECNATTWSSWSDAKTVKTKGKIYVNANATGNNDGFSWANAHTDLNYALANMGENRDIWVATGTYKPDTSNRNSSFNITTIGTNIYGGFNGTETSISQRNIAANQTILSGDLQGNDDANITFNNATRTDNSYHVVTVSANNVVIDGVTITSGYADTMSSDDNRFGAGILKGGTGIFKLKNTTIKDNVAYWGSGLALKGTSTGATNITIENCVFDNNLSSLLGSAFYILTRQYTTSNVSVVNCLIKNNKTTDNGARKGVGASAGYIRAYNTWAVINATIVNNTIVNNSNEGTATSDFPTFGLSSQNGSFGTVTIANNIFWGNTKNGGLTAAAFGKTADANLPNTTTIYNSIDEDDFSNFANKVATNNSNPLFISASDFTLQSGSPAIDNGDNSYVVGNTDVLNNQRIFNTTVDMGAYEFDPTLSTEDIAISPLGLIIYPNPVKNILNIELEDTLEKIEIYSSIGQKVMESNSTSIDTNILNTGIYLLKVYTAKGRIGVKRFVKQ